MKITKATWEKRNFGMDVYEIFLDKKDLRNFDEVFQEIKDQGFQKAYVVIKMPVGNLKALHALEDDGYRFLETQLYLNDYFQPKDLELDIIRNEIICNNLTIEQIPKIREKWEEIIQKITPGTFDTDRVSLDPILGEEIASKRYQNWCRDLFDDLNSIMYVRKINGEIYGFGIDVVDKTGSIAGVLGAIFPSYRTTFLGISWIDNYAGNVKTAVSSNNPSVTKIHQHNGRIIYKMRYVLRKKYD